MRIIKTLNFTKTSQDINNAPSSEELQQKKQQLEQELEEINNSIIQAENMESQQENMESQQKELQDSIVNIEMTE